MILRNTFIEMIKNNIQLRIYYKNNPRSSRWSQFGPFSPWSYLKFTQKIKWTMQKWTRLGLPKHKYKTHPYSGKVQPRVNTVAWFFEHVYIFSMETYVNL